MYVKAFQRNKNLFFPFLQIFYNITCDLCFSKTTGL
jgi:hypothetical protein